MFFLLPLRINKKYKSFPYLTVFLITVNVIVFFGTFSELNEIAQKFGFILNSSCWYTWFTSLFLHGSISHLFFNMYFLWIFGSFLEDALGRFKCGLLYFCGGFISAFTHALIIKVVYPAAGKVPLVGASGAIAAVMGLFALRFLYYKIRIAYFVFFFYFIRWGVFEISSIVALLVWFLKEFLGGALQMIGVFTGVAHWAHVGGFVFGLLWAKFTNLDDEALYEHYLGEAENLTKKGWSFPALERYERALKMRPGSVEVMIKMAPLLAETKQPERAALFYQVAIKESLKRGDRQKAVDLVIDARDKLGGLEKVGLERSEKYFLACALEARNYLDLAEKLYKELLNTSDLSLREKCFYRLGKLYQKAGRVVEAKEVFAKFLKEFPGSEWGSITQGEIESLN